MEKNKFVGEWSELASVFGYDLNKDDDELIMLIRNHISSNLNKESLELNKEVKQILHNYLDALIEAGTYEEPVFRALKEVEDDWTFVQWFNNNLRLLWT